MLNSSKMINPNIRETNAKLMVAADAAPLLVALSLHAGYNEFLSSIVRLSELSVIWITLPINDNAPLKPVGSKSVSSTDDTPTGHWPENWH
jgi:hypothetical protein